MAFSYGNVRRMGGNTALFFFGLMTIFTAIGLLLADRRKADGFALLPLLSLPSLGLLAASMLLLASQLDVPFDAGTGLRTTSRLAGFLLLVFTLLMAAAILPDVFTRFNMSSCCATTKDKIKNTGLLILAGLVSWGLLYFSMQR